jgi:hypothetical protein
MRKLGRTLVLIVILVKLALALWKNYQSIIQLL